MSLRARFAKRGGDGGAEGRGSLGRRAISAGIWSLAALGTSHFLRLAGNLIMTRLILPEAFGLMAMVITLHVALQLLTDVGIRQSVERSEEGEDPHFLHVIWTIQIIRSFIITAILLVVAAAVWQFGPAYMPADSVYAAPELPGLIAISSIWFLIYGLTSTNQYLASRRMQFAPLAVMGILAQVVALVVMVGAALIQPTVWALLWGMLASAVANAALSYVLLEGPGMRLAWDRRKVREIWHFGKWLMGSSILTFVASNADRLLLGALLDKESFGFYIIAIMWVQAFVMVIGKLIDQIAFPAFSEVQRERAHDLPRVFRRFVLRIDLLCLAGFAGLLFGGSLLITLLYPPAYAMAAAFMPFLAVIVLRERFGTLSQFVLSHGDSKALTMGSAAAAVSICIALPLGYRFLGIEGALIATALAPMAEVLPLLPRAARHLGSRVRVEALWAVAICVIAACIYAVFAPILPAAG